MSVENAHEHVAREAAIEQAKDRVVQLFPKVKRENLTATDLELWAVVDSTIKAVQNAFNESEPVSATVLQNVREAIRPVVPQMYALISNERLDREFRHELGTVVQSLVVYPDVDDGMLQKMLPRFLKKFV